MKSMRFLLVRAFCLLALASLTLADELILRNGTVIAGTYLGGDARSVRFVGPDGNVKTYSVGDVSGIGFGTPQTTAAPPVSTAPPVPGAFSQRQVAHSPTGVTVPAGTLIAVRLIDSIDADLTGVGERFRASIDDPIVVGSQVVVPRYADATVQVMRVEQSGAVKGSDEVALKIYDITVNGRSYHVATDYAELQGTGKGRKTIRNTAIGGVGGAVIGGILGGKKGAAIGAGAGAGTGVAVAAARGTKLQIPSETRLEFVLRAPLGI